METEKFEGYYLGADAELNVNLVSEKHLTMDEYDFYAEFYCYSNKRITIHKKDMTRVDANNYTTLFNTEEIGAGTIKAKVVCFIPNSKLPSGIKKEIVYIETGIPIVKV